MNGEAPIHASRRVAAQFPEMDPLASEVVINLIHTEALLADELAKRLRPHGITQTGFRILAILRIADEPLRPMQIAERLRVTRGTVTGLLDSLEKRDLVRRAANREDRRMLDIELTDSARALQVEILPVQFAAEQAICASLDQRDREELVRLLGMVQATLLELSGRHGVPNR